MKKKFSSLPNIRFLSVFSIWLLYRYRNWKATSGYKTTIFDADGKQTLVARPHEKFGRAPLNVMQPSRTNAQYNALRNKLYPTYVTLEDGTQLLREEFEYVYGLNVFTSPTREWNSWGPLGPLGRV